MKGILEAVDSTVDDATIISKPETSDCGDSADQDDEGGVGLGLVLIVLDFALIVNLVSSLQYQIQSKC